MLGEFNAWKPSEVSTQEEDYTDPLDNSMMWGDDHSTKQPGDSSYFV